MGQGEQQAAVNSIGAACIFFVHAIVHARTHASHVRLCMHARARARVHISVQHGRRGRALIVGGPAGPSATPGIPHSVNHICHQSLQHGNAPHRCRSMCHSAGSAPAMAPPSTPTSSTPSRWIRPLYRKVGRRACMRCVMCDRFAMGHPGAWAPLGSHGPSAVQPVQQANAVLDRRNAAAHQASLAEMDAGVARNARGP